MNSNMIRLKNTKYEIYKNSGNTICCVVRYFNKNGDICEEFFQNNNITDGIIRSHTPNGILRSESTCINGKKVGLYKNFYKNGYFICGMNPQIFVFYDLSQKPKYRYYIDVEF